MTTTLTKRRHAQPRAESRPARLDSQDFIMAISRAETAADRDRLIRLGRQLRVKRQPMLNGYRTFIDAVRAVCWRRREGRLGDAAVFHELQHLARTTPIPDYDPADDFGIMTALCEAAANGDFDSMLRIAAKTVYPIEEARRESLRRQHGIKMLRMLAEAEYPPSARLMQTVSRYGHEFNPPEV